MDQCGLLHYEQVMDRHVEMSSDTVGDLSDP
jgi:hypothetical protein